MLFVGSLKTWFVTERSELGSCRALSQAGEIYHILDILVYWNILGENTDQAPDQLLVKNSVLGKYFLPASGRPTKYICAHMSNIFPGNFFGRVRQKYSTQQAYQSARHIMHSKKKRGKSARAGGRPLGLAPSIFLYMKKYLTI